MRLDVRIPGGFGKIAGNFQIAVGTDLPPLLAMDKIIGSRNILHRIHQWPLGESVPGHHFHPLQPGTTLQAAGVPHQTADTITRVKQSRHQPPADISGCSGDKNEVGLWHD